VARDESGSAQWSLNALAQAAKEAAIKVKRSQVRTIPAPGRSEVAPEPQLGHASRQGFCPTRTAVVSVTRPLHRATPGIDDGSRTDELGPVIPRTFDPAPGWSPTGHRIKAPLDYGRGPEKTWVYGALRVRDGKVLTRCAASRNSKGYLASLSDMEADNPSPRHLCDHC
jgi:hypothetical protein